MYISGDSPVSQKNLPISFVLSDNGDPVSVVTLPIRPEDLNRTESSRATVHQTLGRGPVGWVDNFGEALPSVTISGNTAWRMVAGGSKDGLESFLDLNQLVQHDYHKAKQDAIDAGNDPAKIELLFVDTLDSFTWSVVPTQFVLRRSKSRPLLFQYQIALQAVSTEVEQPDIEYPVPVSQAVAMNSLASIAPAIQTSFSSLTTAFPFAATFAPFINNVTSVFALIKSTGLTASLASGRITAALNLASSGVNMFRTLAAGNIPSSVKAAIMSISTAFSKANRFLSLLSQHDTYENYSSLYAGTTNNVASMMLPSTSPLDISSGVVNAIAAIRNSDPVLSPLSAADLAMHATKIAEVGVPQ